MKFRLGAHGNMLSPPPLHPPRRRERPCLKSKPSTLNPLLGASGRKERPRLAGWFLPPLRSSPRSLAAWHWFGVMVQLPVCARCHGHYARQPLPLVDLFESEKMRSHLNAAVKVSRTCGQVSPPHAPTNQQSAITMLRVWDLGLRA